MSWLIVAIIAYFLFSIVFLLDKYLLTGPIPNPKVYAFYIGMLGILVLVLVPFVDFRVPGVEQILLSLLAGALFVYALSWFLKALKKFEPSRIVPAIGGILPIFTFLLIYIFSGGKETLNFWEFSAFILFILGSVLITYEKDKKISLKSFRFSVLTAFFIALSFVLTKYVYLAQPFWSGYIWIRIGGVLMALSFLFSREMRGDLFKVKVSLSKRMTALFLLNQTVGASANVLQNWAIALAPLALIAVVNALQGVQYVFLLIFTVLISFKFPQILKEDISRGTISQKIIAILLIGAGFVILALK